MYQKNKSRDIAEAQPITNVDQILAEIENSIRNTGGKDAYELSLRATQLAPDSVEAWILRATLAPSLEERLVCVNRLNELGADSQDRHNIAFFTLKELLDKNPFLAYLEETEELYRVMNANHMVLSIPKKRSADHSTARGHSGQLTNSYRLLTLALIGLMAAGVGTLVFAPLAALSAIRIGTTSQFQSERLRSTIVFILALILFAIGAVFSILFVLHLRG